MSRKESCPECHSTDLFPDPNTGDLVCRGCGMILDSTVFADGQQQETPRTVLDPSSPDAVRTIIAPNLRDGLGKGISDHKQVAKIRKLQRNQSKRTRTEQAEIDMEEYLEAIASALDLPPTIQSQTLEIFRSASKKKLLKRHRREDLMAVAVSIACKQNHFPGRENELIEYLELDRVEFYKHRKYLLRGLGLKLPRLEPGTFLGIFNDLLHLAPLHLKKVQELLEKLEGNHRLSSIVPKKICAAIIYLADEQIHGSKGRRYSATDIATLGGFSVSNLTRVADIVKIQLRTE